MSTADEFLDRPTKCPVMAAVKLVGRAVRTVRRLAEHEPTLRPPGRAFTLVELLVVLGIITLLVGTLLPALSRARAQADAVACAANLRSIGQALLVYVNDHDGRLPYVIEPIWKPIRRLDMNADPFEEPQSLARTLERILRADVSGVLRCRSALLGYPADDPKVNYRVSSANNYDGIPMTVEELVLPSGAVRYEYSLKQLNGRKWRLLHLDGSLFPFRLAKGPGPFYVVRDFVGRKPDPNDFNPLLPHNGTFNQLMLDMSVTNERDSTIGLTSP
ncbi:MAG: type II secretion system protein [Tepidisphaerales bacterium]